MSYLTYMFKLLSIYNRGESRIDYSSLFPLMRNVDVAILNQTISHRLLKEKLKPASPLYVWLSQISQVTFEKHVVFLQNVGRKRNRRNKCMIFENIQTSIEKMQYFTLLERKFFNFRGFGLFT